MDGTWKPEDFWGGFAEDMLVVASVNDNLPADVKTAVTKAHDDIKSGKLKPFTGPMKSNEGKLVIEAGHTLTDEELAGVNWFIEGIDATIPK